jgi:hypothetical protein
MYHRMRGGKIGWQLSFFLALFSGSATLLHGGRPTTLELMGRIAPSLLIALLRRRRDDGTAAGEEVRLRHERGPDGGRVLPAPPGRRASLAVPAHGERHPLPFDQPVVGPGCAWRRHLPVEVRPVGEFLATLAGVEPAIPHLRRLRRSRRPPRGASVSKYSDCNSLASSPLVLFTGVRQVSRSHNNDTIQDVANNLKELLHCGSLYGRNLRRSRHAPESSHGAPSKR